MIDRTILEEIFPIPDIDKLKREKVEELQEKGFVVTNFSSGGIFNTILMIILQIKVELVSLLRQMLNCLYVRHAEKNWLELLAQDFSKERKAATRLKGNITLKRLENTEDVTVIPAGTVFKTDKDINGEELRFFSVEKVVMLQGDVNAEVPVEAEMEGSKYNIPPGQITKCMQHLNDVTEINNEKGWITTEGSDIEDWESLRERTLGAWAVLATMPTAAKYKNICESVEGVLNVSVHQLHPRGQGTVDIIVTGTAGAATEELLQRVQAMADTIKAPDDDVLVKSAVTVSQDIELQITIPKLMSEDGIIERATSIILNHFRITRERRLNEFIQLDLLYALKNGIPLIKNVKIMTPEEDVILDREKVIICGTINIDIIREV